MRISAFLIAILSLAGAGSQQGIPWLKLDQAKALSAQTGKLVLAFVACEPKTGASPCGKGSADKAFADPAVLKRQDEFYFVRISDKKTSEELRAAKPPEVIFLDGDGDEVCRSGFTCARTLEQAMDGASQKYAAREIPWIAWAGKLPVATEEPRRPLVLAFADEKKDSQEVLKALEDRTLVKYHERVVFVKVAYRRDSEEAKRWGVQQAPALVAIDPVKPQEVLEKTSGKRSVKDLKGFLIRTLVKLDKK